MAALPLVQTEIDAPHLTKQSLLLPYLGEQAGFAGSSSPYVWRFRMKSAMARNSPVGWAIELSEAHARS